VYILIPKPSIRTRVKGFIQDKPVSSVIGGIFFWLFFFLFLTAATETLGLPVVSAWLSVVTGFIPKILSASLIGVAGVLAGAILRDLVVAGTASAGILYGRLLGQLTMAIVILVAAFVAFDQIGINISFLQNVFVVGMAALLLGAALAFGLGSRTSVANILASYYLQRTYHVGDQIEIGERKGKIIEIGPVAVILDSPEGRICIPAREFSRRSSVLLSNE
jgi:small-conductance mechanosensitive channel